MNKTRFALVVIAVVFLAQLLFFYRGIYLPPPVKEPDFLSINVISSIPVEIKENFTKGSGTVLIDLSHGNNLNAEDLNLLFSGIIERGYSIEYVKDGSNLAKNLSNSASFVIISPSTPFSSSDVKAVKDFVAGGGRMLMISEPIKKSEINSLATEFGMLFWNDYLYNLKENEGNFKNIYLTEFAGNNITRGLHKVVFFTSGSVFGKGIIFTDNNTYSSSKGEKGRYSVAAMNDEKNVLAIGDATFMSEPYDVMDNKRLVYNIADFLAPPSGPISPGNASGNATSNVTRK
ncbi:MAG: hypothetical protein O8C66_00555 [Candidatus Methanoperedens sp.]|nr:hypothetical protein [Candidatus Methanoperedens sp.]MCZ7368981.1 hypothetical protein [Candidatus Methanoperedens sp.]